MKQKEHERGNLQLLFWLYLMALAGLSGCSQRPVVFATSDSPDGKYRCVVTEQSPRWPQGSPFLYTFTIKDQATKEDLAGQSFVYNYDSARLSKIEFKWEPGQLIVTDLQRSPPGTFLIATIDDRGQRWTSTR